MDPQAHHAFGEHAEHSAGDALREQPNATIELREEELQARTQSVEAGKVRLDKNVVEEQQTINVPVTRDEVTIERHPVDRRPADAPIGGEDETIRVPVREDQVTAEKRAVVYEEVNVGKRAVQETQRVSDTVQREVIDVDTQGDVDLQTQPTERR